MKIISKWILLIVTAVIVIHFILPRFIQIGFNETLWKIYPKYRYAMSSSLVHKIHKENPSYDELISILGIPEYDYKTSLTYFLRSNFVFGLDSDWIDIELGKDGSVKAYVYNID